MPVRLVKNFPGFSTEDDARAAGAILEFEGYDVTVQQEADGTFTLVATKIVDEAENVQGDDVELSEDGSPQTDKRDINDLLDFIAKYESGGNYNAYYGHGGNQNDPKFTSKTLSSVIAWQRNYTTVNGAASSAAGRYQIIRKTLTALVQKMGLDPDAVRYTQDVQDSMGIKLLEGRGLRKFISGDMDTDTFGNNVAKEWAAMPVLRTTTRVHNGQTITIQPGNSYWSGVAGNRAHAGTDEFRNALNAARNA